MSVTSSVAQSNGTPITTVISYDGLGRKSSSNVANGQIVTTSLYDGRGRQAYTSLPFVNSPPAESCLQSDGTLVPANCTPAYGTLTRFDGINRPTAVLQAGGATTTSQYQADQTLVTDPTGAAKLHTADRDGNLVAVGEDPSAWKAGPLSGSHLNYATNYTYECAGRPAWNRG